MELRSRIFVAGGTTAEGRALHEHLRAAGFRNLVGVPPEEPDLACADQVRDFFTTARPEYVVLVGAGSGGIRANQRRPAELMHANLLAASHVIHEASRTGVAKLLYLASTCAYPRDAVQPMQPAALLTGPLEPTSAAYATAKLAGWQLGQAYRAQHGLRFVTAIPANPFGPFDDFSAEGGHVIPSLMRRMHDMRECADATFLIWGTGTARREFLYNRDLADACLFLLQRYDDALPINVGGNAECTIADVGRQLAEIMGFRGRLMFDPRQLDGAPRKALDAQPLAALGWRPRTPFRAALQATYAWFLEENGRNRERETEIRDPRTVFA